MTDYTHIEEQIGWCQNHDCAFCGFGEDQAKIADTMTDMLAVVRAVNQFKDDMGLDPLMTAWPNVLEALAKLEKNNA